MRYSRSCARWELYLSTPLTSCYAVARPRAVRAREQGSKCPVPVPWPAAAVRLLDCGRRSPDDLLGRQPASAGRVNHACAAAGVSGVVARPRREVGEGPFLPRRRRRLVERVALGGPTTSPSTRHLLSRTVQRSCSPPPPTPRAPQVDQAIEPALASRPWPGAAGPIYTLLRRSLHGPAATPRGQRARRARGRSSPTAMGFARLRWQHLPEACLRSRPPLPLAEACAPPLARVGPGPRARAKREPLFNVPRRWEKQRVARVCLSE